jgi:hypothetical protein
MSRSELGIARTRTRTADREVKTVQQSRMTLEESSKTVDETNEQRLSRRNEDRSAIQEPKIEIEASHRMPESTAHFREGGEEVRTVVAKSACA